MNIPDIARVCHEANRAYCISLGDFSQPHWDAAPLWQQESVIEGVQYLMDNELAEPQDSHNSWLEEKRAAGWKYAPVKDADKKEHPCFVPYEELPEEQRRKDYLFMSVVGALTFKSED